MSAYVDIAEWFISTRHTENQWISPENSSMIFACKSCCWSRLIVPFAKSFWLSHYMAMLVIRHLQTGQESRRKRWSRQMKFTFHSNPFGPPVICTHSMAKWPTNGQDGQNGQDQGPRTWDFALALRSFVRLFVCALYIFIFNTKFCFITPRTRTRLCNLQAK